MDGGGGGDAFGSATAPLAWHDFLERMRQPSAADFVKSIKGLAPPQIFGARHMLDLSSWSRDPRRKACAAIGSCYAARVGSIVCGAGMGDFAGIVGIWGAFGVGSRGLRSRVLQYVLARRYDRSPCRFCWGSLI